MKRTAAFTLVELLVSLAILALLTAISLPALRATREQARSAVCAANLRQLGSAFHMYAVDYSGLAMPTAYTDEWPAIYWWGTNDVRVDHTRGWTWPYLRNELRTGSLYECPAQPWGSYEPQGAARSITSTYGYNGYFLCPPYTPGWSWQIGDRPWQNLDTLAQPQRIFVFGDSMIEFRGVLKNSALLDPPYLYQSPGRWSFNRNPTTSFRHAGRTSALHADGHATTLEPGDGVLTSPEHLIGSVGSQNDPHYVPDWREW